MYYTRIKGKILSLKRYSENRRMSRCKFFTIVCCHQMIMKLYFLIYLRPPSSIPKSKVGKGPAHGIGLVSVFVGVL